MFNLTLPALFIFLFQFVVVMNVGLLLYFDLVGKHEVAGIGLIVSAIVSTILAMLGRRG